MDQLSSLLFSFLYFANELRISPQVLILKTSTPSIYAYRKYLHLPDHQSSIHRPPLVTISNIIHNVVPTLTSRWRCHVLVYI